MQAYRTAAALIARGHEVQVICVANPADDSPAGLTWRDDVYAGIPVRRLSFNMAAAPDPVRWEYDNLWIGEHLRNHFLAVRPDIFHLYGGYLISARPLLVAYELGIPSVVSLTEFWFLCRRFTMLRSDRTLSSPPLDPAVCARCIGEERRAYRLLGQLAPNVMQAYWRLRSDRVQQSKERTSFLLDALEKASVIVSQSRFVGDIFVKAGFPRERIHFCRQGQEFPHLEAEAPSKTPAHTLRVGYLGQVAWHKGVHVLVQAVRNISSANLTLQIYGDLGQEPAYVASLRHLVAGDPRIRLEGRIEHVGISQVYRELDVIVVPSLWYENSPNVIFEAFAHQTPVIAADLGGMAELVESGQNGLLFELGSATDLARQLRRLLDEPDLLAALRAGIGPVKSAGQEMDELEAIYATVARVGAPVR